MKINYLQLSKNYQKMMRSFKHLKKLMASQGSSNIELRRSDRPRDIEDEGEQQ